MRIFIGCSLADAGYNPNDLKLFDDSQDLRWLFFFPHPDDEIALAAWINHLVKSRAEVRCVWLHSNPVRRAESESAMAVLGVQNCQFYDFEDGGFVKAMPKLLDTLRHEVSSFDPNRVVTTAFEQGHLDHDTTNFALAQICGDVLLEFPMYHSYDRKLQTVNRFVEPHGEEVRTLTGEERELRKLVLKLYKSQRIGRILNFYDRWIDADVVRFERLRSPSHNYGQPVGDSKRRARIRKCSKWKIWNGLVQPDLTK